ncbi:unnamed protein product [Acanthoscelides obtectus]|uniref:PiggyBac transposable element-derived protein domain-containing protein n=1 Tax=Acanthoscelides obtectus TaxID=200917 RepID=A0A9P0KSF3_ACAOB|nr:unnamed protein product [Acanthoscelides obtectus]CAK1650024.1 PiggyBac transposable element-derived protein 4 [Acanthoscelides obtectus]
MIPRPKSIEIYNNYMGGVDLLDSMLGYHRILIRSKKFYLRIFFHFLDMLCCNSWILWRRALTENNSDDYLPLAQFKLGLAEILTRSHVTSKKRGRPNSSLQPQLDLKKGNNILLRKYQPKKFVATMWDIFLSGMKIAKFPECKGKTQVWCDKCNVRLCLNKDHILKSAHITGEYYIKGSFDVSQQFNRLQIPPGHVIASLDVIHFAPEVW